MLHKTLAEEGSFLLILLNVNNFSGYKKNQMILGVQSSQASEKDHQPVSRILWHIEGMRVTDSPLCCHKSRISKNGYPPCYLISCRDYK